MLTRECVGMQHLITPTRCDMPAKWLAGNSPTCGLHLNWAILMQIESGAAEVIVRRLNGPCCS